MVLKNVINCLLFLVITISVSGQYLIDETEKTRIAKNDVKVKTEWEHSIADGKVDTKGLKTSVTKYDDRGNVLSKLTYRFNGDTSTFINSKYDSQGNEIEFTKYDGRKKFYSVKKYSKYDPNGNKINERGLRGNAGDYSNYYKYDDNGELVEIFYYSNNALVEKRVITNTANEREISIYNGAKQLTGRIVKKLDSKGNTIQETTYAANGNEKKDNKYKYDSNGNVIEEEQSLYGKFNIRKKFTYDSDNNLIKVDYEKPDGKTFTNNVYKYDARGLLLEERWYNESKNKYSSKKYKYSSTGDLIEANCYFAQFNSQYVYKYQYEKN